MAMLLDTISGTLADDSAPPLSDGDLSALTQQAYIYTLPSVVMYRIRWARLYDPKARWPLAVNAFGHARRRATPAMRAVTAPNVDTLYSGAWLDLSAGPVTLHVPATGERYYSLQFLDFFTNSFAYIGRRTGVTGGGTFLIAGPGWAGTVPDGSGLIRAPTNSVWLIGRIFVDGQGDLERVHALQSGLYLTAPGSVPPPVAPAGMALQSRNGGDPLFHFQVANAALTDNPPPAGEADLLAAFARISVGPGLKFDPAMFSDHQRGIMEAAIAGVQDRMKKRLYRTKGGDNGWTRPADNLGSFGTDYFFRALVATAGVGANVREEAMYFRALADDTGASPNGGNRYVLHFPADGLPPVAAFWSLTVYRVEADLRKFLVPNALNRYAIGSHSDGLTYNADGSLSIYIQHEPPRADQRPNWLPAPPGDFSLTLRAYQPGPEMISGAYRLPQLKRLPER